MSRGSTARNSAAGSSAVGDALPDGALPDTAGADDVLRWLGTAPARSAARSALRRWGLPPSPHLVDDVLAEALVGTWQRSRSRSPLQVDSPQAYGTVVIRNAVHRLGHGRGGAVEEDPAALVELYRGQASAADPSLAPDFFEDDVRAAVVAQGGRPWLVSAALSLVTFTVHPGSEPPGLPAPRAGSTPEQARCWPALWLAGERHVLPDHGADQPDGTARRRTRARRVAAVRRQLERAFAHLQLERNRESDRD